jgi:segregation and condensation protein B
MSSKKKIGKKIAEKKLKTVEKIINKNILIKNELKREKKMAVKAQEIKKPTKQVIEKKKLPETPKTKSVDEMKVVETPQIIIPIIPEKNEPIIEEKAIEPVITEEVIEPVMKDMKTVEKKKIVPKIPTEEYQEDKNKVEALLFACGKYIEDQTISELCSIDKRRLHKILDELRKDYEMKDNALMIVNEGASWKINVREKYLSIVRKIVADTELPKSVMETLAVIAWKTPINQSEVVKIRGNKCYDHIAVLEEAGFVSKDKKGRSYVLKATEKFFTYFEIDHGNLKGVFDTVKVPEIKEEQKTLEQTETINEDEKDKIAAIEVRKWTETEEEKEGHKQFLEQIENKIREAKEKNELLAQEIPRPTVDKPVEIQQTTEASSETIIESQNAETSEEVIDNAIKGAQSETTVEQSIENVPTKPKSLTKKQLEKKFKDELLRVREKMESRK